MVKLSKPSDGKQASLRDKFPILSSLSERPDNSGARKPSGTRKSPRPASPTSPYPAKPLNRSKSLFSLAQSFFKKVDEADAYTTQRTTHTFGTAHTAKELQYRDPLYYRTSGPHLHDQENTPRRASNITPKVQHGTWNPLASIRGRLDKSFFSVRGRGEPQPQPQPEFDAGVGSPMKRRKSLGGLNNAWGTVGKKFTLRGRKRGQAAAALSAYRREPTDDIELPELGPTIYIDEDCKSSGSMPILGLSSGSRVSSSDSRTTALLDREPPEELEPIIIQKSTNGKKRCGEGRTSDISSCSPKTLQPARTRSTSKKVAFASATQLQLMEEAKQRQRVNSGVSDASGCPSLTSADISAIDLSLPTPAPATGAESPVSPRRLSEYAERAMVDEQAEIDLIERMLDDGASFTSVDFDTFHENRRQLRQARYNMLMNPGKQVENFQVFTEVLENTARMLSNVGHADIEVISRGSSFSGPVYTWTDGEIVMRNDTQMVNTSNVSAAPDVHRKEGRPTIHYRPAGIPDVDLGNHYNKSEITVTELVETDESDAEAPPEKVSANDMGLEFFAEKRRGRSLGRTPTKNLAVNNRGKSSSPLKRLQIRLTPNKMFEKGLEDASPSSTMAVRCPSSASTVSEEESTYTLTPPPATTFERLLNLPKRLISHMWTDASAEEDFLDNIDVKWLSRKENQTNSAAVPHFYYSAASKLRHHQYREEVRFKSEGKLPAINYAAINAAEPKSYSDDFNVLDRYALLCGREQTRKAVRDEAKVFSALAAVQAEENAKFRRGTATSNDSNVHFTMDGNAYFTAGETSPSQASIFSGILTPTLTPAVVAEEPQTSPAKFKDVEELAAEFRRFQIEEELRFKRAHDKKMQREQNKRDECCQNWERCEKIGKCFEVTKQEYLAEKARQELEKKTEELGRQFQKFQAEEEAKFKRSHDRAVQREKFKKSAGWPETLRQDQQCCQYWQSCEKVGLCYEVRTKEYLAMKAKQENDMEWKKQHWVEGYSCAKRGSTASEEKKGRNTSFTFMAHGKRIGMATYGGSSFFVKTSSTPSTSTSVRRAMGQDMLLTPELKGKEKASVYDEDSFVLDSLVDSMDYYEDCLDGDNHIAFDDDFHPQPIFTINPSGYTTAIPGGSSTSSSSGAMSPKSCNNHGNIVRCWSPPDLPPKKQGSNFEHGEDIHVAIRGGKGRDTLFEHIQWPPSTQDIFRANYPTNPPGPRTPQRNADSGYWDAEKDPQNGPGGSVPPPDPAPELEPAPRPSSASPKTEPRSPPHSTAAHLLARFEKKNRNVCEVEHNEFIADQHKFLVNSFGSIGSRYTTAQQILDTLEDLHLAEQGIVDEKHAELVKSLAEIGSKNSNELQKVNLELARSAVEADKASKKNSKGKSKAPALPPRLAIDTWKGKAQEWPKQPIFISLEPATTQHKNTWNASAMSKGRNVTPNLCVQTRNITPQATINGKGPVSPLTKAWLESKNTPQITEKKVEEYISAVEKPYPSPAISCFDAPPPDYHPTAGAGNARGSKSGRHFFANVTGDGKAVQIPPIRMLRPSLTVTDRTVSGVSVAATMVDEEFGEDLVDFRVESRAEDREQDPRDRGKEDRIREEMDEMEKRVPSWMLYG